MPALSPHNQVAYTQVSDMIAKGNRCLYVAAPGTGKSLVAEEIIRTNGYHALIVCPKNSIVEQWRRMGLDAEIMTYQKFIRLDPAFLSDGYDCFIFDEAHHCGSSKWGAQVQSVISLTDKPVIGLTATPQRYSDNGADVSVTVWNGNKVEGLSQGEAIARGVLPGFLYVAALFGVEEELQKYKAQNVKESLIAELEYSIRNCGSIVDILHRHMPVGKRKGIIFCEKISAVSEAERVIRSAYPDATVWVVHSRLPAAEVRDVIKNFHEAEKGFLVSVDMYNEGVHAPGVNTIIMLRRTQSPAVYIQQLGRCLAQGNRDVVVFDLVGNSVSTRDFGDGGQSGEDALAGTFGVGKKKELPEEIIVVDYVKDTASILHRISVIQGSKWTAEDHEYLVAHYVADGAKSCAEYLGRTPASCTARACLYGLTEQQQTPMRRWTEDEVQYLSDHYISGGPDSCAEALNRSRETCDSKAKKMGIAPRLRSYKGPWTDEEDQYLRKHYAADGAKGCADALGRTWKACGERSYSLGIAKKRENSRIPWTEEDKEFLRENYETLGPVACARTLKRSAESCKFMGSKMGLRYVRRPAAVKKENRPSTRHTPKPWTENEDMFLRENYKNMSLSECASILGRSPVACKGHAQRLCLHKERVRKEPKPPRRLDGRRWTQEEDMFLREHFKELGAAKCAEHLRRTAEACQYRIRKLGVGRRRFVWTESNKAYLAAHYQTDGAAKCAAAIECMPSSCIQMASKMGLTRCEKTPWTEAERKYLKDHYQQDGTKYCAEALGRTPGECISQAGRMGLRGWSSIPWTDEENKYLRSHYITDGPSRCAKALGRIDTDCWKQALKLGIVSTKTNRWTEDEKAYLIAHYATEGGAKCGMTLSRSLDSCRHQASILGLIRNRSGMWTDNDIEYLVSHYCADGAEKCSHALGRTLKACEVKAKKLGLTQ